MRQDALDQDTGDADRDAVDVIVEQWRRERPDLDPGAKEVTGRIIRLASVASTMDEMQVFYDAAMARMDDALEYLEQFPMDALPEDAKHLLWLYCALVTVAFPIEVWRQPRVPDSGSSSFDAVLEPAV